MSHDPLYQRPAELLQNLIRFDTTNPPGNEAACLAYLAGLLGDAGIPSTFYARTPERPNLVARLPGEGRAAPILLYGHVDVVTTAGQRWSRPPFAAESADGFIWGRGALDMKGGVAMLVAAVLRARAEGARLPGDVVLALVSDEEAGGDFGAKFLVEQHAGLFAGIRYALGEFGGFSLHIAGRRFYPIMVAEKQLCALKAIVRGPAGHGSLSARGGAMARLARMLERLDRRRLPVHVTPPARLMFERLAAALPGAAGLLLRQLLNPALTDSVLDVLGERGRVFDPLLHNTANPTMLQASDKINVIPAEVSVGLDGRLLPGFTPADMLAELRPVLGDDVEVEVVRYDPGPATMDLGLFDLLAEVLRQADPAGAPTPLLLSGVTDGRFFARLGIQTYGFLPMKLPADFNFAGVIHGADERVPADAIAFGANAIYNVLQRLT